MLTILLEKNTFCVRHSQSYNNNIRYSDSSMDLDTSVRIGFILGYYEKKSSLTPLS